MNSLKNEVGYEDLTDSIIRDRKETIKQKINGQQMGPSRLYVNSRGIRKGDGRGRK